MTKQLRKYDRKSGSGHKHLNPRKGGKLNIDNTKKKHMGNILDKLYYNYNYNQYSKINIQQ